MKQKGFTLIELLVVVAIIGILAAVGVVAYNGYTASAKKAVVKQNFKNVVKNVSIFDQEKQHCLGYIHHCIITILLPIPTVVKAPQLCGIVG